MTLTDLFFIYLLSSSIIIFIVANKFFEKQSKSSSHIPYWLISTISIILFAFMSSDKNKDFNELINMRPLLLIGNLLLYHLEAILFFLIIFSVYAVINLILGQLFFRYYREKSSIDLFENEQIIEILFISFSIIIIFLTFKKFEYIFF